MPDRQTFELSTEEAGEATRVVTVRGDADRFRAEAVSRAIDAAGKGDRNVVVDLSESTFMDSSMLATFVAAAEHARRQARAVVLVVQTPRLRRSLEVKGLVGILLVVNTREQALELLRSQQGDPADAP